MAPPLPSPMKARNVRPAPKRSPRNREWLDGGYCDLVLDGHRRVFVPYKHCFKVSTAPKRNVPRQSLYGRLDGYGDL